MIHGVDVSRWQPTWAPAPEDRFVIVKASGGSVKTGGWRQTDPLHDQHVAKARAAGAIVGHYAWMWPASTAPFRDQVDQFLTAAKAQPGDFLVCDWENPAPALVPVHEMEAFTRHVMVLAPQAKVLGYTYPFYGPFAAARESKVPIRWPNGGAWIADYREGGPKDIGDLVPTIHQYTDKPIDQNRANFATPQAMRAWAEELIPMAWTLAPTLEVFRREVNAKYPGRGKASDGTIGNAAHAATASDHNPNEWDDVCAFDLDEDLYGDKASDPGPVLNSLLARILNLAKAGQLPQLNYVIYERKIYRRKNGFNPEPYAGLNAHKLHMHVSAMQVPALYNSTRPWNLFPPPPPVKDDWETATGADVWAVEIA